MDQEGLEMKRKELLAIKGTGILLDVRGCKETAETNWV